MIKTFFPFCWIAIYPREGTETVNSAMFRASMVLQFIPARGRKHIPFFPRLSHPIAIYPREGTETGGRWSCRSRRGIAIYPREGTETEGRKDREQGDGLQFIPARGRKPIFAIVKTFFLLLQFIPARGRKRITPTAAGAPSHCNLSPRGDGNGVCHPCQLSQYYCNLSPRGDGNS